MRLAISPVKDEICIVMFIIDSVIQETGAVMQKVGRVTDETCSVIYETRMVKQEQSGII
ncbi:MAG: hypothetical protein JXN64_14575 [Spirochaetes bacterium]|nr:hypothetical protein [Spirochaetota bacterium]